MRSSDSCTATTICIIACYLLLFLDTFALFEASPVIGGLNRVIGDGAELYKYRCVPMSYHNQALVYFSNRLRFFSGNIKRVVSS